MFLLSAGTQTILTECEESQEFGRSSRNLEDFWDEDEGFDSIQRMTVAIAAHGRKVMIPEAGTIRKVPGH